MIITIIVLFTFIVLVQVRSLVSLLVQMGAGSGDPASESQVGQHARKVLVQIPVYNEGWEVKNAAIAVMQQDYDRSMICLQIIDDSAARIPELVDFLTAEAALSGVDFQYLYRPGRKGYKSGALNYGMAFCPHESIVILDADFIIRPDFLRSTVPLLDNQRLAGVQTRWTYRNQFSSPTTTIQSTIFETIFALEQSVRNRLSIPAFFTGTSAVWRRSVIEEVGGWKEEPFTAEDIDISFRSYHLGYAFQFLDRDLSSCEASPSFMAFKKQQQRWARGVFQAGVDNFYNALTADQTLRSKALEISTILFNLYPLILLLSGVAASIYEMNGLERSAAWKTVEWSSGLIMVFGPVSLGIGYAVRKYHPISSRDGLILLQSSLLSLALAWPMFFGIWQVVTKSRQQFVVTPKGKNLFAAGKKPGHGPATLTVCLELLTFLYFTSLIAVFGRAYPESIILFFILSLSGFISFVTSVRSKYNYH